MQVPMYNEPAGFAAFNQRRETPADNLALDWELALLHLRRARWLAACLDDGQSVNSQAALISTALMGLTSRLGALGAAAELPLRLNKMPRGAL